MADLMRRWAAMLKYALLAGILVSLPASAAADMYSCSVHAEAEYADVLTADVVFVGELTDYRFVPDQGSDAYPNAVMTYNVIETLKGDLASEVQLRWDPAVFAPDERRPPIGLEIVLGFDAQNAVEPSQSEFYLKQIACGQPLVFSASAQNIETIELWLTTGEVRAHELSSDHHFGGPLTGNRPDDWLYWVLMAFIALGAAIAITLAIKRLPKIA